MRSIISTITSLERTFSIAYNPKLYANFGLIYDKGFFYTDVNEDDIESGLSSSNLSYEILGHMEFNKIYIEGMLQ